MAEISAEKKNEGLLDIEILIIFRDIAKRWWVILIFALLAAMGSYVIVSEAYTPQYTTTTTFVVSAKGNSATVYNNLASASTVAESLTQVFNSDVLKEKVAAEVGLDAFDGSVSAQLIAETNLVEMKVTADSPKKAFLMSKAIIANHEIVTERIIGNNILEILQHPQVPLVADYGSNARDIAKKAFLIAALAGIFLFGAYSYLRDTIKSESDVTKKLDTKLLGTVYHEKKYKTIRARMKRKGSMLITSPMTGFIFVETFKNLRTRLEYRMKKEQVTTMMVTSVQENEGKSTIAANIALSFAIKGCRVILIDADLRKPALHKIFECDATERRNISDVLCGKSTLSDSLVKTMWENLSLLLGDAALNHMSDKLDKEGLQDLITQAKGMADYVIVDTPPVSVAPDTECIADLVEASVLVVRQNTTVAAAINDILDMLDASKAKTLGCIFNNVKASSVSSHDAYGYYGHAYGRRNGYAYYKKYNLAAAGDAVDAASAGEVAADEDLYHEPETR